MQTTHECADPARLDKTRRKNDVRLYQISNTYLNCAGLVQCRKQLVERFTPGFTLTFFPIDKKRQKKTGDHHDQKTRSSIVDNTVGKPRTGDALRIGPTPAIRLLTQRKRTRTHTIMHTMIACTIISLLGTPIASVPTFVESMTPHSQINRDVQVKQYMNAQDLDQH